jgi:Aerotolerance regulator N-terminal/von Willebrand factor type A domain
VRFLFPIFLAAGAAVLVPILLHMARRRTRRQVPFSTLMFLESSPPRFERRQRIEHWALLALRCLVFLLLAAAFARPFVAQPVPALAVGTGERLVVLVDTSASMRREGLWSAAQARVRARLARAGSADRVAVMAFDRRPRTVVGFDQWAHQRPDERVAAAAQALAEQAPGWESTDLGRALMTAAEAIVDDEGDSGSGAARVALVSDLQEGSRLDALGISDWPARIALEIDALESAGPNASLQALPELVGAEPRGLRVRISTSGKGADLSLNVRWSDGGSPLAVTLPAGQSRVIDAPARAGDRPGTLLVEGDAAAFDDQLHVAPPMPVHVSILYLGSDDGSDPQQPLFYLRRAFPTTRLRAPEITARRPEATDLGAGASAQLAVVTAPPGPAALAALRAQLERGRSVLAVMDGVAAATTVGALAGVRLTAAEAGGDALLTEVNLSHPILAPFADARFGDFTKIRFWRHRRLDEKRLPGARVLARFDDGAPAWLLVPAGRGALFVMTAGWQPADSQLALSSKFVPLLHGILEASAGLDSGQAQFFVGDPVTLPAVEGAGERRVRRPDGRVVSLEATSSVFTETEVPGLYTFEAAGTTRTFAVNLDPAESATAPMPPESLERLGLGLSQPAGVAAVAPSRETGFYAGLERDQRLWRWLLVAALAVVLVETAVAARASRRTA